LRLYTTPSAPGLKLDITKKLLVSRLTNQGSSDVGTKVPEYQLELGPSYQFETSPGNHQVGYLLDPPEIDRAKVERLLDAMVRGGLAMDGADPGMRGVTRYARLPVGWNNKAKHAERLEAPFVHQISPGSRG
jgi:hypothetical protein